MVNGARLSPQPRSTIQTSRLRELAARVKVVLPDDSNTSESAREEWVWSLVSTHLCTTADRRSKHLNLPTLNRRSSIGYRT